jgi:hypothetical protein
MSQQLERLVAEYLSAVDRYEMRKVHALRQQMRQFVASIQIGPIDSSTKSSTTFGIVESAAPTSTTRPKPEPTLRLKSIVD